MLSCFKRPKLHGAALDNFIIRTSLIIAGIITGLGYAFGPASWHSSDTYHFINLLNVPWIVYGVWFVISAALLIVPKTRPVGYLLGGILFTFFAIATWLALPTGHLRGISGPCNITTLAVLYWVALKSSIYQSVEKKVK